MYNYLNKQASHSLHRIPPYTIHIHSYSPSSVAHIIYVALEQIKRIRNALFVVNYSQNHNLILLAASEHL